MSEGVVVVDASVLVAIFKGEPDASDLSRRAFAYRRRVMSTATWFEAAMVCEGTDRRRAGIYFDRISAALALELVPLSVAQARLAREAFRTFGRGRHPKASLNLGDCFVYALCKDLAAPLLYKGGDFAHTDIAAA